MSETKPSSYLNLLLSWIWKNQKQSLRVNGQIQVKHKRYTLKVGYNANLDEI